MIFCPSIPLPFRLNQIPNPQPVNRADHIVPGIILNESFYLLFLPGHKSQLNTQLHRVSLPLGILHQVDIVLYVLILPLLDPGIQEYVLDCSSDRHVRKIPDG